MYQAQVSSKGQVVIPKPLRDRLGIAEGMVVSFTEDALGLHLTVQREPTRSDMLQSLQAGWGLGASGGRALTASEMRAGVKAAFRRKPR